MSRRRTRGTALAALTVLFLSLGSGVAAAAEEPVVARAEATAVRGLLAGTPEDSGTFTATHDGRASSTTGAATPQAGVLGDQRLLNLGVLAQEATASFVGGAGASAACA
ncbi:MAG: hypothetical protein WBQ50_07005, partial [Nocardioides sp.]